MPVELIKESSSPVIQRTIYSRSTTLYRINIEPLGSGNCIDDKKIFLSTEKSSLFVKLSVNPEIRPAREGHQQSAYCSI